MKLKYIFSIAIILFVCQQCFAVRDLPEKKINIAVTTSHLSSIINEICKDKVNVITLIPATICPSNYDLDAETLKKLSKTNIIMYHSWQQWTKSLKYKLSNLGIVYREIKTEGNFMIPYINLRAAEEIKNLMIIWDMKNKDFYEENFSSYVYRINYISEEISKGHSLRYNKKIVCHTKIADFMQWLGFNVVMKYNKQENISSQDMKLLVNKIKTSKVKIVVDNLQVGTDIGRTLSSDLNLKHVIISNFPLANSYISTLKENISKIDKVLQ